MRRQPVAVYLLNFISMWECFSYYGMRALLVLYMVEALKFQDKTAFLVYGFYVTLAEIGGVAGGLVADRLWGLKKSIRIGAWVIFLGHLLLGFSQSQEGFFGALGLIVIGTSLFRNNAAALLGTLYPKGDARLGEGYTLYYTGINIGGFLAAILCGVAADQYGWHAGFGLASFGMLMGALALKWGANLFPEEAFSNREKSPFFSGFDLKAAGGYVALVALFFACEEQLGSSLVLFAERFVDKELYGFSVPAPAIIAMNPFTIMVMGPFLARFWKRCPLEREAKIQLGFVLLSLSFFLLYLGVKLSGEGVYLIYVLMAIFVMGIAELFFGPTALAAVSELSPKGKAGSSMSVMTLGYAAANLLSAGLSQGMAMSEGVFDVAVYETGFLGMSLGIVGVIIILPLTKRIYGENRV